MCLDMMSILSFQCNDRRAGVRRSGVLAFRRAGVQEAKEQELSSRMFLKDICVWFFLVLPFTLTFITTTLAYPRLQDFVPVFRGCLDQGMVCTPLPKDSAETTDASYYTTG
jgi:hypothetical protein